MASKLARSIKMKKGSREFGKKLSGEDKEQHYGHMRENKSNFPKVRTKSALIKAFSRREK